MSHRNHYMTEIQFSKNTSPSYPRNCFNSLSTSSQVQARAVDYFYGRISRDEAEGTVLSI